MTYNSIFGKFQFGFPFLPQSFLVVVPIQFYLTIFEYNDQKILFSIYMLQGHRLYRHNIKINLYADDTAVCSQNIALSFTDYELELTEIKKINYKCSET